MRSSLSDYSVVLGCTVLSEFDEDPSMIPDEIQSIEWTRRMMRNRVIMDKRVDSMLSLIDEPRTPKIGSKKFESLMVETIELGVSQGITSFVYGAPTTRTGINLAPEEFGYLISEVLNRVSAPSSHLKFYLEPIFDADVVKTFEDASVAALHAHSLVDTAASVMPLYDTGNAILSGEKVSPIMLSRNTDRVHVRMPDPRSAFQYEILCDQLRLIEDTAIRLAERLEYEQMVISYEELNRRNRTNIGLRRFIEWGRGL